MIIYGAGTVGRLLYEFYKDEIACFVDDNPSISEFCGLPVHRLEDVELEKHILIISVADIADVKQRLAGRYYYLVKPLSPQMLKFIIPKTAFEQYALKIAITCHEAYRKQIKFYHSVDLIITERCSLKCKDCSNLMQYYLNPIDCDTKQVLQSIDELFDSVDEIGEVRVIGGEPFMNKDWHIIVKRLVDEPKLHRVVIYTNGTIVPKEMPQSDKILVFITDYGKLSGKIDELVDSLNVPYVVKKAGGWTACSDIIRHRRTDEENEDLFNNCCVRNLKTLSDGKLYKCPFAANIARLGYKFHNACDWCNGRPYGAPEIPPAIQME